MSLVPAVAQLSSRPDAGRLSANLRRKALAYLEVHLQHSAPIQPDDDSDAEGGGGCSRAINICYTTAQSAPLV